jgi:hypothetical protein
MASTDHPITTPPGLARTCLAQPRPTLLLHPGRWQATCRSCGQVLVQGWRQDPVEPTAARTSCPVGVEVAA